MGDAAVRETDIDAAVSRLSAVNAGYLQDPFASYFVKRAQARPPLINIGTFIRTWAIDRLVHQFLDAPSQTNHSKKQILSLGAGTDTRFFRIASEGGSRAGNIHRYVEVDFPEATTKKAMTIRKQTKLAEVLGSDVQVENGGTNLISPIYSLISGDLRSFSDLAEKLRNILDPCLPTLVLAECVFIYLEPQHSDVILKWSYETFGHSGLMAILYDPVGLDDAFGKVMIGNLNARGLHLLGVKANTSIESKLKWLRSLGFTHVFGRDVCKIRNGVLPPGEKDRLSKLEMLDEIEELDLLLSHYSVTWAYTQPDGMDFSQSIKQFDGIS